MTTIRKLIEKKGGEVWAIAPTATVYEAVERMAGKEVGALLVLDGDALVGIVSERDYARKVILEGRSSRDTPVADIMTRQVVYVRPDQGIEDAMALMTEKRIRHLPVVEGDDVLGMISIGDLVKAIIADQRYTIAQLEQYIRG